MLCLISIPLLSSEEDKETVEQQIREADQLFEATLFDRAIPLYTNLLSHLHVNTELRAKVRLRLAQAFYFTEQYQEVPQVISEINPTIINSDKKIQKFNSEALYLLGVTYKKIRKYDPAVTTLLHYLSFGNPTSLSHYENALFELGLVYYYLGKYVDAKQQFDLISENPQKLHLFPLSRIYLARIAVAEGKYEEAEERLDFLSENGAPNDFLRYAISFVRGEILYRQKDWQNAVVYFEKALPENNPERAEWYQDAYDYLGWCYLNLAKELKNNTAKQKTLFCKAEEIFQILLQNAPSDRAYLALGQCLLVKGLSLGHEGDLLELERILSKPSRLKSREAQHHALLLRAEAAPNYKEREKFFRQLTNDTNWDGPNYANAWYLRGLNELDEGQTEKLAGQDQVAKRHLEEAITFFGKAFDLFYPSDIKLAAMTMKYKVQAYYFQNTRGNFLKGVALLSKLLNQYRDDLFSALEEPDEIYFLQGLIASQLLDCDEGETFYNIAESSLVHGIESYPKGNFYDESLKLLGTLYCQRGDFVKAEQTFLDLAQITPSSPFAGEAWFWAANCVENMEGSGQKSQQYRKFVYDQFPESPFAAEAYFRYYNYVEYLKGQLEAIEHLKAFETRFPKSPFLMNSYYLLGLDYQQLRKSLDGKMKRDKDELAAIEFFQKVASIFDTFNSSGLLPRDRLEFFTIVRFRALMEQAFTYLSLANQMEGAKKQVYLEDAEAILRQIYLELDDVGNPLIQMLASGKKHAQLQEECAYHLAKCYTKLHNDEAAERVMSKILARYKTAKITRGYYLSRIWYEQGMIAFRQKECDLAIQYFGQAEDAGKGNVLSIEELLDLWIQKSLCYRVMKKMDDAMLILSRVINYDAISSQRLKAMYLRAEIYEEQGRHELARRQLEATAKKGGKWANKAKTKLEENYVYQ